MTWNTGKFFMALAVAIITGLVLVAIVGPILVDLKVPVATTVGEAFVNYGFPLGIVAGIFYYFGYKGSAP